MALHATTTHFADRAYMAIGRAADAPRISVSQTFARPHRSGPCSPRAGLVSGGAPHGPRAAGARPRGRPTLRTSQTDGTDPTLRLEPGRHLAPKRATATGRSTMRDRQRPRFLKPRASDAKPRLAARRRRNTPKRPAATRPQCRTPHSRGPCSLPASPAARASMRSSTTRRTRRLPLDDWEERRRERSTRLHCQANASVSVDQSDACDYRPKRKSAADAESEPSLDRPDPVESLQQQETDRLPASRRPATAGSLASPVAF
jgi:hypothetical protein